MLGCQVFCHWKHIPFVCDHWIWRTKMFDMDKEYIEKKRDSRFTTLMRMFKITKSSSYME
jgi:hypothetical protein